MLYSKNSYPTMIFDTTIAVYVLIGVIALLILWIIRLEYRLGKLLSGKKGADLEDTIFSLSKSQKETEKFKDELRGYLDTVEKRLGQSVQSIETVRFNPFRGDGSGGNQSFSTSFLDEKGDGVVLSGLYTRDRVSTYSKPIKNFTSTFELTDEEKSVIDTSKHKLSNSR